MKLQNFFWHGLQGDEWQRLLHLQIRQSNRQRQIFPQEYFVFILQHAVDLDSLPQLQDTTTVFSQGSHGPRWQKELQKCRLQSRSFPHMFSQDFFVFLSTQAVVINSFPQ
jgi:hypothetical protein